ncbi:sugar phosphate isomerase/epimerase family protein [Stutzerimonas xanthomarina]|uniref:sugar phosphate isomerase/epimerase family protein n=1 Tax=Stutzerimonas xanthomarina TaxID=271420 RepID=UPI003AA8452E
MKLSISNIAWDIEHDASVAELLSGLSINAIDIAPGKYFPVPEATSARETRKVRDWWGGRDIQIIGMQSLLFGTVGLNMFGSAEIQNKMLNHLAAICRIASELGATWLVFGSPKNRDRSGLCDSKANDLSTAFFRRLGHIASDCGVTICLEPNPECYGANFMTSAHETLAVIKSVAHPAIKMQFDTGALTITGEDPVALLSNESDLIAHIHASEPELVPLGSGKTNHSLMAEALKNHLPEHFVTVEMLNKCDDEVVPTLSGALNIAQNFYGSGMMSRIK